MFSLRRLLRRLLYGRPVIVVSGLPRSGTSMMMNMLEAGGVAVWHDGLRRADDQNPHGYYELERVKDLNRSDDKRWVRRGRGRAIKVISMLLEHLPRSNNYQVIFMHRDLDEILASQSRMLARRGELHIASSDVLQKQYAAHLRRVLNLVRDDPAFTVLEVTYADVVNAPRIAAERVRKFLGLPLDVRRMATVADNKLYRNRASSHRHREHLGDS